MKFTLKCMPIGVIFTHVLNVEKASSSRYGSIDMETCGLLRFPVFCNSQYSQN